MRHLPAVRMRVARCDEQLHAQLSMTVSRGEPLCARTSGEGRLAAPEQRVRAEVHEHGGHARRAALQRVVVRAVLLPRLVAQDLRSHAWPSRRSGQAPHAEHMFLGTPILVSCESVAPHEPAATQHTCSTRACAGPRGSRATPQAKHQAHARSLGSRPRVSTRSPACPPGG